MLLPRPACVAMSSTFKLGPYQVALHSSPRLLIVTDTRTPVRPLLSSIPGKAFVEAASARDRVVGSSGCWVIHRDDQDVCHGLDADTAEQGFTGGPVHISGPFADQCKGALRWNLTFARESMDRSLRFDLSLHTTSHPGGAPTVGRNRIRFIYSRDAGERFFGFGQQYTLLDAAGSLVPIFAREQGIGRGLQPITATLNALGREAGGDNRTTYSAVPHYITSRLRSLHLVNTEPCEFDLRRAGEVQVELSGMHLRGRVLGATSALALVEAATTYMGRMPPLPEWAHTSGVIVGMQGGTARVAQLTRRLVKASVPLAAVWLQDWAGAHVQPILGMRQMRLRWNWRLDTTLYPEWPALVANLSSTGGVRILTYINTFLDNSTAFPSPRFPEALAAGVLLRRQADGRPVTVRSGPGIEAGLLDLTGAKGANFTETMVMEQLAIGSCGWMADFGEYVPLDSQPLSGESANVVHNDYPRLWQAVNARAVEQWQRRRRRQQQEARPAASLTPPPMPVPPCSGAPLWFARSSGLTSPGIVPLFWLGDQLHSWDQYDGLASVVKGMLSSGLSGHALTHSDTGGYTTASVPGIIKCARCSLQHGDCSARPHPRGGHHLTPP